MSSSCATHVNFYVSANFFAHSQISRVKPYKEGPRHQEEIEDGRKRADMDGWIDLPEHGCVLPNYERECRRMGKSEVVNVPLGADGLKRLTAEQYNNTVVDIFPSAGLEAVVFPFELDVDGFDNNTAVNTATPTSLRLISTLDLSWQAPSRGPQKTYCPAIQSRRAARSATWWRPPAVLGDEI